MHTVEKDCVNYCTGAGNPLQSNLYGADKKPQDTQGFEILMLKYIKENIVGTCNMSMVFEIFNCISLHENYYKIYLLEK